MSRPLVKIEDRTFHTLIFDLFHTIEILALPDVYNRKVYLSLPKSKGIYRILLNYSRIFTELKQKKSKKIQQIHQNISIC